MGDSIRSASKNYLWKMQYAGEGTVQGVNANAIQNLRLSNQTADLLTSDDKLSLLVRADTDGIWLEKASGGEIAGSKKTWQNMNIQESDWNSGNKISKSFTYTYSDTDGINDTFLSFDFWMNDITSIDSVIDGLDGMKIGGGPVTNKYEAVPNVTLDQNICSASITGGNTVFFSEERNLGRDFDDRLDEISTGNLSYNKDDGMITLSYKNSSADVITYRRKKEAPGQQAEDYLKNDLNTYLSCIILDKKQAALAGKDPQTDTLKPRSIQEILGNSNITTSGYLSEMLTITGTMKCTDGDGSFKPGAIGKTYPAASIDFSPIGDAASGLDIKDLLGTGFNSDCLTCDNYYAIRFDDFYDSSIQATNETPEGYRYQIREENRSNGGGRNYSLRIDVNSLVKQGITTGDQLAEAMISITSRCFDMHFTQYAAEGSKFYIYDNREWTGPGTGATFDTAPVVEINKNEFRFQLATNDGRNMEMSYEYNYADVKDWVQVNMTPDTAGGYVREDETDITKGYRTYDPAVDTGLNRYSMNVNYINKKDNSALTSEKDVIDNYAQYAVDKMMKNTTVTLKAQDYTYMGMSGKENPNVAIKSVFDMDMSRIGKKNGIRIQNSGIKDDYVMIPTFRMNTFVLNLHKASAESFEEAQQTIQMADDAIRTISNRRSLYGAWQNRLEHTYKNSCNREENIQAAESRIRDADMSKEMLNYAKHTILEQASQSILAAANQTKEGVLNLLK